VGRCVNGQAHNGRVALATRDHGGEGPDLLFLPGAGQTLVDCDLLAPWLTAHHRVVAMDLRGHGGSGDGTFTWDAALDDVDAVVAALGLKQPAVVGHSLGGMLAVMYGARRPSSGVVNLDGHGEPRAEHYTGVGSDVVAARMAKLRVLGDATIASARQAPVVLPEAVLEAMAAEYQARFGLDEVFVRSALTRSHVPCEGGLRARLSLDTTLEILALVRELDLVATYRSCQAPLLVVNAVRPDPVPPGSPPWMAEHLAGFRSGVSAELVQLCAELPRMSLLEIDATHALIYEEPELVAKQVVAFLAEWPRALGAT
jgi:pimeloyl-ACP methyl ester carboxylesterase